MEPFTWPTTPANTPEYGCAADSSGEEKWSIPSTSTQTAGRVKAQKQPPTEYSDSADARPKEKRQTAIPNRLVFFVYHFQQR